MEIVIMIVAAFAGFKMAESKGHNPALWAVLCGLIPLALILLYFLKRK